jgi:hypothetical protein
MGSDSSLIKLQDRAGAPLRTNLKLSGRSDMRIAVYVRVSRLDQAKGAASQEHAIRRYLTSHGLKAKWFTGRRSGKSRIAALIGAHAATLAGLDRKLSPGEAGLIAVVSPTKKQGTIVRNYVRSLFDVPMLKQEIIAERSLDAFTMRSGTRLEILASDYRSVRGFTLLGVVVDEVCFMGLSDSSRVSTDTALIRSLEPALATTGGKLIAISSPYSQSGWAWESYKKHYGSDGSQDFLVINELLARFRVARSRQEMQFYGYSIPQGFCR